MHGKDILAHQASSRGVTEYQALTDDLTRGNFFQ
jgi:hypothetical protein